jgi:hypothetical protein
MRPVSRPSASGTIEVKVAKFAQLFHSLDPFPFRERDLDRDAEEFIVDWAREMPRRQPLAIVIHVPGSEREHEHAAQVEDAIQRYFRYRAEAVRHDLHELFVNGRISLVIGLCVLALCVLASQVLPPLLGDSGAGPIVREGLIILGWVANWRPAEIFLYDWWPLVRRRNLYRRLSQAPVKVIAG